MQQTLDRIIVPPAPVEEEERELDDDDERERPQPKQKPKGRLIIGSFADVATTLALLHRD
jgi:hypothetical protein